MEETGIVFSLVDAIGLAGAAFYVAAYVKLQFAREFSKTVTYSIMNFLGAALMLVSLTTSFNLSSFVIQCIWAVISIFGIYRCFKYKEVVWWVHQGEILDISEEKK